MRHGERQYHGSKESPSLSRAGGRVGVGFAVTEGCPVISTLGFPLVDNMVPEEQEATSSVPMSQSSFDAFEFRKQRQLREGMIELYQTMRGGENCLPLPFP